MTAGHGIYTFRQVSVKSGQTPYRPYSGAFFRRKEWISFEEMIARPSHILSVPRPGELELAAAYNYRDMVCLQASAGGGEVVEDSGLVWTYAGADQGAAVPFGQPTAAGSGPALDRMMAYYRAHPPKDIGYWSLDPAQPAHIGVQLLARGFQPG
ncbi:MAG: hypothetical protein JST39_20530, partial [Bacteroidetes bacterium]|nr:hypothetical protein [Bacteroidota bacterium]